MTSETRQLVEYRLSQAQETLAASRHLLEFGHYRDAINRAYYAMFYAALGLLAGRRLNGFPEAHACTSSICPWLPESAGAPASVVYCYSIIICAQQGGLAAAEDARLRRCAASGRRHAQGLAIPNPVVTRKSRKGDRFGRVRLEGEVRESG